MATGGFKSSAATDFLEEWKAKREKMRAKMLGDIAAATGTPLAATNTNSTMSNSGSGNPDKSSPTGNCLERSLPAAPSAPTPPAPTPAPIPAPISAPVPAPSSTSSTQQGGSPKKPPVQTEVQSASPGPSSMACNHDSDGGDSPSPSRKGGREKKSSSGPSARKGKRQIEKRKLREKRRSTGVVNIRSNESLDELDDDDGEKDRSQEEDLVQTNTFQNEAMTADSSTGHITDTARCGTARHKSFQGPGVEDEASGSNRRQNRHRDGASAVAGLEKRLEELERELHRERQETARLLKAHEEKDDLIGKLKEEIDLLNRDLDDIEDENDQLKQENKTLLKVVGQLTR